MNLLLWSPTVTCYPAGFSDKLSWSESIGQHGRGHWHLTLKPCGEHWDRTHLSICLVFFLPDCSSYFVTATKSPREQLLREEGLLFSPFPEMQVLHESLLWQHAARIPYLSAGRDSEQRSGGTLAITCSAFLFMQPRLSALGWYHP